MFGMNPNAELASFLSTSHFSPLQIWSVVKVSKYWCSFCFLFNFLKQPTVIATQQIETKTAGYLRSWTGRLWGAPPDWAYMVLSAIRSDVCEIDLAEPQSFPPNKENKV
jgi:hypothetical protein